MAATGMENPVAGSNDAAKTSMTDSASLRFAMDQNDGKVGGSPEKKSANPFLRKRLNSEAPANLGNRGRGNGSWRARGVSHTEGLKGAQRPNFGNRGFHEPNIWRGGNHINRGPSNFRGARGFGRGGRAKVPNGHLSNNSQYNQNMRQFNPRFHRDGYNNQANNFASQQGAIKPLFPPPTEKFPPPPGSPRFPGRGHDIRGRTFGRGHLHVSNNMESNPWKGCYRSATNFNHHGQRPPYQSFQGGFHRGKQFNQGQQYRNGNDQEYPAGQFNNWYVEVESEMCTEHSNVNAVNANSVYGSGTGYQYAPSDAYDSHNYILEYYEVDELGNHYPIADQSCYPMKTQQDGLYYDQYYTYQDQSGNPSENAQWVPEYPPQNTSGGAPPIQPPVPTEVPIPPPPLPNNPGSQTTQQPKDIYPAPPKTPSEPQAVTPNDPPSALSNFEFTSAINISADQLKSLAETVASLESQTQNTPSHQNDQGDSVQQPISQVITNLMNRKDDEAEDDENQSKPVSALGISLEMDPNPGNILDRLETKFSAAAKTELEVDEESSKASKLEANLAKAYSHFLQESEKRKRHSSILEDSEGDHTLTRSAKKVFDVGMGISLDINYDVGVSSNSDDNRSVNSDQGEDIGAEVDHGLFSSDGKYGSPVSSSEIKNGGSFPFNMSRRQLSPPRHDKYSHASHNSPSPSRDLDDEDDRRSSSPEAPPVLIEDDDEEKSSQSAALNRSMSPHLRDSPSPPRNDYFDDDFGSRKSPSSFASNSRSSFSSHLNSYRDNSTQRRPSFVKRAPMFCRFKFDKSSEPCNERFFSQHPEYFEHYKNTHGLRNGVPCIESKCRYVARNADNFVNHIKVRHRDKPLED